VINRLDVEEITKRTVDTFRTLMSHHSVDLSSNDFDATRNFLEDMLSNYVDNQMLTGVQED
jgi:hypothetical protein